MRKSVFYIIISILAILVMFAIQLFSVLRIYNLEQERFDYRYSEIIGRGVDELENINPGITWRSATLALDDDSYQLLKTYYLVGDTTLLDEFRIMSFQNMRNRLVKEQNLDGVISKLLEKNKIMTEFNTHYKISEITFFKYPDTIKIFNEKYDADKRFVQDKEIPEGALHVNYYSYEGSFFRIVFDSYVDFVYKKRIVIGQMVGILVVMAIALIVVAMVFLITLRNMMEERRLSQLKTDFINNMTHELKTPLSTIAIATKTMGSPGMLDDREKANSMIEMIGRQNKYLSKQINHLLEVSMWEKGQFELDKKKFDLKDYLHALAEAFRWECKDKKRNVTLHEDYDGIDNLTVFWDETQMTMAIHNLLVNGSKYCNQDPVIYLRAKKDNNLIIEVQDNGIGISREQQKHIFDKFYRVHTGNIHKVKGLGLGLFYVRQIVEAHKGEVSVRSKTNHGSTFTIKIPYHG